VQPLHVVARLEYDRRQKEQEKYLFVEPVGSAA
jgi:hypothetical protein